MEDVGKLVVRTLLQVSLDTADSAAKAMTLAITMHRCLWLQCLVSLRKSNRPFRTYLLEDLLLFSVKTDDKHHRTLGWCPNFGHLYTCPKEEAVPTSTASPLSSFHTSLLGPKQEKGRIYRRPPPLSATAPSSSRQPGSFKLAF